MGYGWRGGRGRGWFGPWPGRGPFSFLPPWQRPGWLFGRGACWWLFGNPWLYAYGYMYPYYPSYLYWFRYFQTFPSWFYPPYPTPYPYYPGW